MTPVSKNSDIQFLRWASKILNCEPRKNLARCREDNSVYRLSFNEHIWYLKISEKVTDEKDRLSWLSHKIPAPKVIGFTKGHGREALLMSAIPGIDLAHLCNSWPTDKIVKKLAEALISLHSIEIQDCPFGKKENKKVLVHGDACLPNFIFLDDIFSGYIDLGDVSIGHPEIDLSAAVWSLQHNLGAGYGLRFLQEYGVERADEAMVEKLRQQY